MKITRYLTLIMLMVFLLNACQEVESPVNNIPTVTTGSVENVGTTYACLTGNLTASAQAYFLVSTSPDLSNAIQVEAFSSNDNKYSCEISNLSGHTTYYYALCATDGRSELIGNILSFTTKSILGIEQCIVNMWANDGTVNFVPEDAIGVFLFNENNSVHQNYGNLATYYRNSSWSLPYEIGFDNQIFKLYAYYPYNKEVGTHAFAEIPVTANGNNIDYLYGCSENLSEDNPNAHIEMSHALSKVTFSITKSKNSDFAEWITSGNLRNNNSKAISWDGLMNVVTGEVKSIFYENDGIIRSCEFQPQADKANVIEMYVIPTSFAENEVIFNLNWGSVGSIALPTEKWEAGKHYDYPLEITKTGLKLGEVKVEEWENNNGGSIIINQ
ncbi:MAG: fimbrillin family protein [Bacteroidaceae bacterium]|nr:fimbrillin family protein [Bacteroidaceae bacterium]